MGVTGRGEEGEDDIVSHLNGLGTGAAWSYKDFRSFAKQQAIVLSQ
jgi:hypothetical protein